ncbi:hypothetical protein BJ742DRAFT_822653 [Cladochytrium replicatum]|nr:hypothetical protein BJ742DRAFT_822653 [Cladochytrium replicatum]
MEETFERAWCELTGHSQTSAAGTFERLTTLYKETHRYYHTLRHIDECLDHLDRLHSSKPQLLTRKEYNDLFISIWFHDVIYNPRMHDNEEKSAEVFLEEVGNASNMDSAARARIERIAEMIVGTKRHELADGDTHLHGILYDIDLSVLGSKEERFEEYDGDIRGEYAFVPEDYYRTERAKVLEHFLKRERIYKTEHFEDLESRARSNLRRAIEKCGHTSIPLQSTSKVL